MFDVFGAGLGVTAALVIIGIAILLSGVLYQRVIEPWLEARFGHSSRYTALDREMHSRSTSCRYLPSLSLSAMPLGAMHIRIWRRCRKCGRGGCLRHIGMLIGRALSGLTTRPPNLPDDIGHRLDDRAGISR